MPSFTVNVLYLGNFSDGIPDLDPNGVGPAEGAGNLVNTVFTAASNVDVTVNDINNDGGVEFDGGAGGENISFDLGQGAGTQTENVDQGVWYDIQIVLDDNSVLNTSAVIFQTAGGETFLTEFAASLDNLNIQSIEVTGVNNASFSRTFVNEVSNTTVCFAERSLVLTPAGVRRIEDLALGDLVMTKDKGALPIRTVLRSECPQVGSERPIRFAPGSLGPNMPSRPLLVSPNHRILCRSKLVHDMFGVPEIFLPAKRFLKLPGVSQPSNHGRRFYINIELTEHSVLMVNNALVESCLLGQQVRQNLPYLAQHVIAKAPFSSPCRMAPKGKNQHAFIHALRAKKQQYCVDKDWFPPVLQRAGLRPCA